MAITKATASSIAPAAKGDLVAGTATNDAGVLAVGANGTVLTAASGQATGLEWATASSGGMTLITTTSMSGVASQSFNNVFSSTYDNYRIVINGTTITGTLTMRFRVSGTDSSAASYKINIYGTGLWTSALFAGYTENNSTNFNVLAEASPTSITLDVLNPFATQKTFIHGFTTQDDRGKSYNGIFNATTSFTGFSLIPGTNITGNVSVYGYNK